MSTQDSTQYTDGSGAGHGEYMLTTTDNPWDPFTQFVEWFRWDTLHGYHTSGLLARLTYTSHELSEADQAVAIQLAINEIVTENVSGMHIKVSAADAKA